MRILGIDPGTERTGYGVIELQGNKVSALTYGVVRTKSGTPAWERLLSIYEEMMRLCDAFVPQALAIERLFFKRNVTSAIAVGQARGVVLLAAAQAELRVMELTPAEVKQAVTGYGNADKQQVGRMVVRLLNLPSLPTPDDAADAVALALAMSFRLGSQRLVEAVR